MADFETQAAADFNAWFNGLQNVLDDNAATNLLNITNALDARVDMLEAVLFNDITTNPFLIDLELLLIDEDKRKDTEERRKFLNAADLVFLCLPDAAAVEAVSLIENGNTKVIDASTAHRTAPGWAYGFAELSKLHRAQINFFVQASLT